MSTRSFFLITGLSGAGKSHALRAFEDMGFYCVDNLPRDLVSSFTDLFIKDENDRDQVAIALDVREGDFVDEYPAIAETIRSRGIPLKTIFLEATNDALLNRYMESRRPHPLGNNHSLEEAIVLEREMLAPVREDADMVIDTTEINIHQFRGLLTELNESDSTERLTLSLTSFGFKHGKPAHLDTLFDARFLGNPHYEEGLRECSGLDPKVQEFMEEQGSSGQYFEDIVDILELMLNSYCQQGKIVLSVGIGCTGGQHRSVWLVDQLASYFSDRSYCKTVVTHRDADLENPT